MSRHPLVACLTEIRCRQGLSQREVADRLGCTRQVVAQRETGPHDLCVLNLITWADVLGRALVVRRKDRPEGVWICDQPTLAAELRRLRARAGLSMREAARRAGVIHQTVSLWESRKRAPGTREFARYLTAFGRVLELEPIPGGVS